MQKKARGSDYASLSCAKWQLKYSKNNVLKFLLKSRREHSEGSYNKETVGMGAIRSKFLPYVPQSLAAAALGPLAASPAPVTRWRMHILSSLIVTTMSVALSAGCSSKMSVSTVGGIKKAATAAFKVTALSKIVTAPGEVLTLTGSGFRSTLSLAQISGLNLNGANSPAVTAQLAVESGNKATVTLPASMSFGKYALTLTQDGESQQITLFSNGGKTDYPVFTAGSDKICIGEKFYDETGSLREGTKVCNLPLPDCSEDGAKACTANAAYTAAATNGLADKVVSGQTVAGIAGNLTLPDPTKVRVNNGPFGIAGTSLTPTLAECASDGGINCVAVASYPAAKLANFSNGDIRSGVTVAGIIGSASAESHSNCTADGATNCVAVTNFPAVDKLTKLIAGNIKKDIVIAGVTGDYPSSTHPLVGADNTTTDLPTFASVNGGGTYQWFKSDGTRLIGTVEANASVTPGTTSQVLNTGLYRQVTVAGDVNLVAGNIKTDTTIFAVTGSVIPTAPPCLIDGGTDCVASSLFTAAATTNLPDKVLSGATVAGIAGNVTIPDASKVLSTTQYGVAGTSLTGTLALPDPTKVRVSNGNFGIGGIASAPALADCSADGGTTCVAVTPYAAALTSSLGPKVVSGNTVAGVTGTAIAESHSDCSADGAMGCVAVSSYTAAATTGLASKVLSGSTVAGVPGNVTLPTAANVYSGIQFGVAGTGVTGTLTTPTAANVRTSNGLYGVGGTGSTPLLTDCSADGDFGLRLTLLL
ncbi:MAG: hypothetical protein NTY08_09615 [Proteobacteria bacterium]|nr:hypothetical protein [Pseudomonadota bacterium]